MYIDNQKNNDYGRFTPCQHSKNEMSPIEPFQPSSPIVGGRSIENHSRYLRSPGSEGSNNQKQVEANPQDAMQCQKVVPDLQNGGSKISDDKKEPVQSISTQKVMKLEDDQVLQLQSYLQQKVSLSPNLFIFFILGLAISRSNFTGASNS
jgi:hypothetical protein